MLTPTQMVSTAVKALDDKKARDIRVLHTADQTVLADYFIVCNGTSSSTRALMWVEDVPLQTLT